MRTYSKIGVALLVMVLSTGSVSAATVIKNHEILSTKFRPTMSSMDHFESGKLALERKDWSKAKENFRVIVYGYPKSPHCLEAKFYLGTAFFYCRDYEYAEEMFNAYLDEGGAEHFELAIKYLFYTAEAYRNGHKRHLFCVETFPRWLPGYKQAEEIYDRIVDSYPGHEYAAKALMNKGRLMLQRENYQAAVSSFVKFIQRYPFDEQVPDAYCEIADTYLAQARKEYRNPDLLVLADINLKQFGARFPKEERLSKLEEMLGEMREVYATGLYQTAEFYERMNKPQAAVIYYFHAKRGFPNTGIAESCGRKLESMSDYVAELNLSDESVL